MNLFETDVRKDTSPRKPSESEYAFLNRSALPEHELVRNLLEQWFHDYPSDAEKQDYRTERQKSFRGAFQAKRDRQHHAAFFELYCYTLLRRHLFDIDIEFPVGTSNHRPDFFAQSTRTPICFLEATLAAESDPDAGKERNLHQIREMIYALPSPDFWIGFHVHEAPLNSPPIPRMRSELQNWLQTHSQHELRLNVQGWDITFSLLPKSQTTRGNQESGTFSSYEPQWIDSRSAVLKPLEDKAKNYKEGLEHPYIIALNALAMKAIWANMEEVFLGKELVEIDRKSGKDRLVRAPFAQGRSMDEDGLWFGRLGVRNRQVSAVLIVDALWPLAIARRTPILWHNPWAQHPLRPDIWQGPQKIFDLKTACRQDLPGKQGWELLQLNPNWPNDDPTSLGKQT
jgi:hypothetical protein